MRVEITRWGLKHDYRGAHCTMPYQGRTLLGEITGLYRREVTGSTHFKVRHFNGEEWPFDPGIFAVEILERTD